MKVNQLSIFLENRAGRLAEVTRILSEAKVNIRALSLADTSDFGILRLIVSDFDKAKEKLKEEGFTVGRTSVVAVEVSDDPGGLHNILSMLQDAGINVEYMYAFVQQSGDSAVLIFRFDRTEQGIEILQKNNITIIPGAELYGM
ncbi:Amino acid-binding ACT domain protein [Pseudodesulfovibrio profundus]|uniref:Amino acid-binding ACT domain protein n=1 Tax=Pseudodesulfovibrio profundus TaxID=57320 RepID=A0A2C8F4Y8_9BACT|nr:ACT domain-containing protein [Pseudodesulfovibrio profundus]SOB57787.1 Amino acid-binding ACT domain protein [Pseudodesulfovibrio profundus]|tara:strand:+ start:504 stop:935 length:432 start_codon:yes stop_codon:yes gene_type:complete